MAIKAKERQESWKRKQLYMLEYREPPHREWHPMLSYIYFSKSSATEMLKKCTNPNHKFRIATWTRFSR